MNRRPASPKPPRTSPAWRAALYFLDHTQEVVIALTACTILYTHFSPGAVYFTTGAVTVSRVAKLLKHIFRKPRPEGSTEKLTYGMPSTHSSVIIYYATYVSLAALLLRPEPPWSALPQYFGPLFVAPWAVTIAISRIWLGHHTVEQVAAGSTVGVLFGCGWFWWWNHGAAELTSRQLDKILPYIPIFGSR
ncbi:hypothetical protein M407DRAFT_242663 [Tulasnella calospora MUT 4182]|uniref:Phosphatidic acid phosphatase type 2/haloperoxidase domain-containing protein n=1 Tax=Tulasnella calospora MUT 4182 TaxID=1051891 RepID=A0A0C3M6P2_9AGAM|nr:hypothetical protein M407DRAFT_242663 [Tulasnella calospora MUT 4182]